MGKNKLNKVSIFLIILLFVLQKATFAIPVEFYSSISESKDTGMIKMTEDMYFSQLSSLENYEVIDKRPQYFDIDSFTAQKSDENIIFFAEIQEGENSSGWVCILTAIEKKSGKKNMQAKIYDSYYKILLDSKQSLRTLLSVFTNTADTDSNAIKDSVSANIKSQLESQKNIDNQSADNQKNLSIEDIAGNWDGEPYIDKIVIMRGGRGFVIFKNGASMLINITISGNKIHVKQVGKSNASYYPELPRELALKIARDATPIEWSLIQDDKGSLSGTKDTIKPSETVDGEVEKTQISVVWNRKK
ncbi:MAG: hypothetical protein K6F69_09225 [Treponema sp.]|nr:hypothetical protein [Treponema sp.]